MHLGALALALVLFAPPFAAEAQQVGKTPRVGWLAEGSTPPQVGSEDCNTANAGGAGVHAAVSTGSRSNCVSDVEAFDMVGNVWEWVADWVPLSPAGCPSAWTPMGTFSSDDFMCLSGAETTTGPGALIRGGSYGNFEHAGVFAVVGQFIPSRSEPGVGFRAAR